TPPPDRPVRARPMHRAHTDNPGIPPRLPRAPPDWPGGPRPGRPSPFPHRPGCLPPAARCATLSCSWPGLSVACPGHVGGRQRDMKPCALVRLGLGPDPAAVTRDDAPHVGQADAVAGKFRGAMQALEYPEQLVRVLHVETGAIVGHREFIIAAAPLPCAHLDPRHLALAGVLDRVAEQILPYRTQHVGVADHHRKRPDRPDDTPALMAGFGQRTGLLDQRL